MAIQVKAKYDYNSGHEDDLSFSAGQVINVTEEVDEEWYNGEYHDNNGKQHQGMFPRNFVTLHTPETTAERSVNHKREEKILQTQHEVVAKPNLPSKQAPAATNVTTAKAAGSPPAMSSKVETRPSVHEDQPTQQTARSPPPIHSKLEGSSSFRDRIAAFNKTSDAPLAPKALPKPASFVRKPFIPPPPSKEAYFAPPKPIHSTKSPAQHPPAAYREKSRDIETPTVSEPPHEGDIGKETLKERILAIQKGLDYTTKPPVPPPPQIQSRSETEDHHENDQIQETDSENSDTDDTPAPTNESAQEHIPEEVESVRDVKVITENVPKTEDSDKAIEPFHSEDSHEAEASDVDPEVARRIAIRERMAKMSGGMGMHMGMGMAPSPFAKAKPQSKAQSVPLTSPSYERRDPIPVIPGLPLIKSVEPEREAKVHPTDEAEGSREIYEHPPPPKRQSSHASNLVPHEPEDVQSSDEAEADDADSHDKEVTDSDEEEEEGADDHVESMQEVEASDNPASLPSPSRRTTEPIRSIPEQGPRSPVARQTSFHGPSSSIPSIPTTLPPSLDQSPRSNRPPPPPPPLSPPSQSGPPPVPVPRKFDSLHELSMPSRDVQNDEDYEDDSSVISEEDQYAGTASQEFSRDFSPSSPISKPPPPPLPPSSPPGSPAMFSPKAVSPPPVPIASRPYDVRPNYAAHVPAPPSIPAPPVPPAEKYSSTDFDVAEPQPPFPTSAAPEPASFRRTYSERHSLEAPQARSSMDHIRRDGVYLAMKEENIQDGRMWWVEKGAPPTVYQNRADLVFEVEDSTSTRRGGRTTTTREVYVLFSDYSQTVITVTYDRDDPSQASFNQRHLPPPDQPSKGVLENRHEQVGSQIVSLAQAQLGTIVGDGTPLAFVSDILSKLDNCLPSVGARAHGATIYNNFGNSSTRQFDEIRPGDIVAFRSAVFQAHGGLRGKITTEVGKPDHVAIVQEWNGIKKKLKVLEQRRDNRKVSPNSYKIGDLRSGELHVFRPMPRSWVDW